MAVTYDKVATVSIEEGLRKHLDDEFQNVYIGHYRESGNESVRIILDGSSLIQKTNLFEEREFTVRIRYYFKTPNTTRNEDKGIKDKMDKMRKHILDKQVNGTLWTDLSVDEIIYNAGIDDEDELTGVTIGEFGLTFINYNQF
mgnify:CR=1 FL=1